MREYCAVSDPECRNPAGYGTGMGSASNPDPPRISVMCPECGDAVCENCGINVKGRRWCPHCVHGAERRARKAEEKLPEDLTNKEFHRVYQVVRKAQTPDMSGKRTVDSLSSEYHTETVARQALGMARVRSRQARNTEPWLRTRLVSEWEDLKEE